MTFKRDERPTINIRGREARLLALLDEMCEETVVESEARIIIYQFPEDERPEGVPQTYKMERIENGSLEEVLLQ